MKHYQKRRLCIVPQRVNSQETKFALAVSIESRNGTMFKVVPGMLLFTQSDLEKAKHVCESLGPVVDLRLK